MCTKVWLVVIQVDVFNLCQAHILKGLKPRSLILFLSCSDSFFFLLSFVIDGNYLKNWINRRKTLLSFFCLSFLLFFFLCVFYNSSILDNSVNIFKQILHPLKQKYMTFTFTLEQVVHVHHAARKRNSFVISSQYDQCW